ncbi:hypothetical protein [Robinsoniella peoriensis]|nr:hypothetical protein [Robinsoniella peoriensis]
MEVIIEKTSFVSINCIPEREGGRTMAGVLPSDTNLAEICPLDEIV